MSKLVAVAGATGYAGRFLVQELANRGYRVRALVRSRTRAETAGPHEAPALKGLVNEWREGEITDPNFVSGACLGADHVVSALGVTRQKASPWDVDYHANLRLLEDAEREGLQSFLYINVMHVDSGSSLIMRSKAAFAQSLARSSVHHQIINPSGYLSDVSEFLAMAKHGVMVLPPAGEVRIAPIHGEDLARFSVDKLTAASGAWDVGGPDVFHYRDIAEAAAIAVGKDCKIITLPHGAVAAALWGARRIGGRTEMLAQFFADGLTHDAIGERYGEHHLQDFFKAAVKN